MTVMAKPVAVSSFLWVIFWWMPGRIVVHVKKKKLFFLSFFMLYIGIKVALRACSLVNRCFSVESITFYLNCNWKLASW